jgi:hypothetical protein
VELDSRDIEWCGFLGQLTLHRGRLVACQRVDVTHEDTVLGAIETAIRAFREDRHLVPYKVPGAPHSLGLSFFLPSSLCITPRFSLGIQSFPPCRQATGFQWLPRAANRAETAIPTDLSLNWA